MREIEKCLHVPITFCTHKKIEKIIVLTVSALFEPRGSIFQNGFLGGVLLIFDLPGVVIETGLY